MASEIVNFVYLSEMLEYPIIDSSDHRRLGRVTDIAASSGQVYLKIAGVVAKMKDFPAPLYIPWSGIILSAQKKQFFLEGSSDTPQQYSQAGENEFLLKKSFMDRQLISTSGNKVIRVNDLQLLVEGSAKGNPNLWLVHVDIGLRGLLRRLGWERIVNAFVLWLIGRNIRDKLVSWKYIQPTSATTVSGSLHLSTDTSKLAEIHPADLADIIEDLGTDDRISLIESLDTLTAAQTVQEIPLRIRVQIAETLAVSRLVDIIHEMHPDDAVDLLDELSPEIRNEIYSQLPQQETADLKDLSKLSLFGVGSIMNSDFISVLPSQTLDAAFDQLRANAEKTELLNYVYVLDDGNRLKGVVTVRQLLMYEPELLVADIMSENVVSAKIDANIKRVAELFYKYNFVAIPIIDRDGVMQGIITQRDALKSVLPEMNEDAKA